MKARLHVEASSGQEVNTDLDQYHEVTIVVSKTFRLPFSPFTGIQIEFSDQQIDKVCNDMPTLLSSAASDCLCGIFTIGNVFVGLGEKVITLHSKVGFPSVDILRSAVEKLISHYCFEQTQSEIHFSVNRDGAIRVSLKAIT